VARPDRQIDMNPRHAATLSRIMTVTEIAEYLQVHRSTVYKLVRKGRIPAFKIGSDFRFHRDVIDKWMVDQQAKKGSQI
jgi:excisionase family DNA binding protein